MNAIEFSSPVPCSNLLGSDHQDLLISHQHDRVETAVPLLLHVTLWFSLELNSVSRNIWMS